MALWMTLFAYYVIVLAAGIGMLLLLLAGHWLGMFFLILTVSTFALAAIVGIGEAQGRPWARRMARLLFKR